MTALAEYLALLDEHDRIIDAPGWYEGRQALVAAMDRLWSRLTKQEREAVLAHQWRAYARRIGAG